MDGESEIRNIEDLEAKLADVTLPFDEIVPVAAREWLENCRESRNISRDVITKCTNIDECTYWKKLSEGVFYV